MNSFLKITHTPAQTSNRPSSTIDVELGINANFLLKDEFPLKVYIKNIFDKKIIYSCELNSNSWCNYPFFEYNPYVSYEVEVVEVEKKKKVEKFESVKYLFDLTYLKPS